MRTPEVLSIARRLFKDNAPTGAGSLLLLQKLVLGTGAKIQECGNAPAGFFGVLIAETIYLNASLNEWKMTRVLAHEWCHYLRRREVLNPRSASLYSEYGTGGREDEELIARAFEAMF